MAVSTRVPFVGSPGKHWKQHSSGLLAAKRRIHFAQGGSTAQLLEVVMRPGLLCSALRSRTRDDERLRSHRHLSSFPFHPPVSFPHLQPPGNLARAQLFANAMTSIYSERALFCHANASLRLPWALSRLCFNSM